MTRYETKDGKVFEAENLTKLIDALHADSFESEVPLREWMHETAKRARQQTGFPIYGSATRKKLAEGLITAGLIKVLEDADA